MLSARTGLIIYEATRHRTRTGTKRNPVTGRATSDLEAERNRR